MYTLDNTVNDLLSDKFVKKHFGYLLPMLFLGTVPKELRDDKLSELPAKLNMPWGVPYLSQIVINAANDLIELRDNENYEFVQLWSGKIDEDFFPAKNKKEEVSLLLLKDTFKENRPIALISPGGAYMDVAVANEGLDTARSLREKGYAVAVLRYRVAPNRYPDAMLDLTKAIKYLRIHAHELNVNGDDLMTIGFSAGSHLSAIQACYAEEYDKLLMAELEAHHPEQIDEYKNVSAKPDKVCLSYPVLSLANRTAYDVYANLAGQDDSLMDKLSLELNAQSDYPKTYMWGCQDDEYHVADHIGLAVSRFENMNVEYKHHIYPSGGHGISIGLGTSAEGWVDEMVEYMNV